MSTAKRIADVAKKHRDAQRQRLINEGAWLVAGNPTDESLRCTRYLGERRCTNARQHGSKFCYVHTGRYFFQQVRFTQRSLDDAVAAHLRWLGHDV